MAGRRGPPKDHRAECQEGVRPHGDKSKGQVAGRTGLNVRFWRAWMRYGFVIDQSRCIGCKSCMQACPYDALYIDPNTNTAAKCNYCAHRVEVGLEPACVIVCPAQAIISGDLDDPGSRIARIVGREQVQVRKVEQGTRPK